MSRLASVRNGLGSNIVDGRGTQCRSRSPDVWEIHGNPLAWFLAMLDCIILKMCGSRYSCRVHAGKLDLRGAVVTSKGSSSFGSGSG